jgi:ABC-type lipopolysaccharide export system ATPase subunit
MTVIDDLQRVWDVVGVEEINDMLSEMDDSDITNLIVQLRCQERLAYAISGACTYRVRCAEGALVSILEHQDEDNRMIVQQMDHEVDPL